MNVLLLKRWLSEIGPGLIGARLDSVAQLDIRSLLLLLNSDSGTVPLVVSVLEEYPVLAVLGDTPEAPAPSGESNFCKALRFHLKGMRLVALEQTGFDRSVVCTFRDRDKYGVETIKLLRVELAGRSANAFLISDKGMVISIFKRIRRNPARSRQIVTGKPLPSPPPVGKFVAAESGAGGLEEELAGLAVSRGIVAPDSIRELFEDRIAGCDRKLWPRVEPLLPVQHDVQSLFDFIVSLQNGDLTPVLFDLGGAGNSANDAAMQEWQSNRRKRVAQQKPESPQRIRLTSRLDVLLDQFQRSQRALELEQQAIDLLSRMEGSPESSQRKMLEEWQAGNQTWSEQLDSNLAGVDNVRNLITYSQRLKRGREKLERLIAQTQTELEVLDTAASARDPKPRKPADPLGDQASALKGRGVKFLRFISSDGYHILCGVSDQGNEGLLKAFGNARHLWFHARDYPGSHVIVLSAGRDVPRQTIEEAAVVAAWHSKGREEPDMEVSFLSMKHLRRPRKPKPGQVLKTEESVVSVRPAAFESLKGRLQYRGNSGGQSGS